MKFESHNLNICFSFMKMLIYLSIFEFNDLLTYVHNMLLRVECVYYIILLYVLVVSRLTGDWTSLAKNRNSRVQIDCTEVVHNIREGVTVTIMAGQLVQLLSAMEMS